jgi:hypothetical protein
MAFAIVTPNGKYHGHIGSEAEAMKLAVVTDKDRANGAPRLLTEAEWQQVVAAGDKRAELCGTLGKAL